MAKKTAQGILLSACLFIAPEAGAVSDEPNKHAAAQDDVAIEHAEIILAPPGGKMMAGYLAIWNGTAQQADLTKLESAAFGSVSLHNTVVEDGVARMRPLDGVPIPGHAELLMRNGGIHLMLGNPTTELQAGDTVDLDLTFHDGTRVSGTARILPVGAKPTDHHHDEDDEIVHQ